jgi:hypothetical protein
MQDDHIDVVDNHIDIPSHIVDKYPISIPIPISLLHPISHIDLPYRSPLSISDHILSLWLPSDSLNIVHQCNPWSLSPGTISVCIQSTNSPPTHLRPGTIRRLAHIVSKNTQVIPTECLTDTHCCAVAMAAWRAQNLSNSMIQDPRTVSQSCETLKT